MLYISDETFVNNFFAIEINVYVAWIRTSFGDFVFNANQR